MATYSPPGAHFPVKTEDPTAVLGRRLLAAIIDLALMTLIGIIAFFVTAESIGEGDVIGDGVVGDVSTLCDRFNDDPDNSELCLALGDTAYFADGADVAAVFFAPFLYAIVAVLLLEAIAGGSLGKLIVGLRVVKDPSYEQVGFGGAFLRWIMWIVDGIGICVPMVGPIMILATQRHRRVGDMAAKTLVIDRHNVGHPPPTPYVPAVPPPPGTWAPPATPPVEATATAASEADSQYAPGPNATAGTPPAGLAEPILAGSAATPPAEPPDADIAPPAFVAPGSGIDDTGDTRAGPPGTESSMPGVSAPTWDEARDTYIQWDPELNAWMQWDDLAKRWKFIDS